jgi:site-specific DNA recombinase
LITNAHISGQSCSSALKLPYASSKQDDTLLCPYTDCDNVSSKLYLVEREIISAMQKLVENYKLNESLTDNDNSDTLSAKKMLLEDKKNELEQLNLQKTKQFDFLEKGIYTTEIFLERSEAIAKDIENCSNAIEILENELQHDKLILEQKNNFVPKCEHLLSNYWDWDVATKNAVLKELIDHVDYLKTARNSFRKGDEVNFNLIIYPKIQ